jgi:hypothetical protein
LAAAAGARAAKLCVMVRVLAAGTVSGAAALLVAACSTGAATASDGGANDGSVLPPVDSGVNVIEKGRCLDQPNGAPCGDGPDGGTSECRDAPTCENGACVPHPKADGTTCGAKNPCVTGCVSGVCVDIPARPDGFNWKPGDYNARCCGGMPLATTTSDNCGACGIKCNAADGQSCGAVGKEGHYYCLNCVASVNCWSGCCSTSFTPNSCAASDCTKGLCVQQFCPPNTTCKTSPDSSDYCGYN